MGQPLINRMDTPNKLVEESIRVLGLIHEQPKTRFSIREWVNSPFLVTVLGGVVGLLLTNHWTSSQREKDFDLKVFEEQRAAFIQFADDLPDALNNLYQLKLDDGMRVVVAEDHDTRSAEYVAANAAYYESLRRYNSSKSVDAVCAAAGAFFPDADVAEAVSSLSQGVDALEDIDVRKLVGRQQISLYHAQANQSYAAAVAAMRAHIRSTLSSEGGKQ